MSGQCSNCGSSSLTNVDGLFFCENCGTQNRALRELAVEEEMSFVGFKDMVPSNKKKKKTKEDKNQPEAVEDTAPTHEIFSEVDYPANLREAGLRLTTATYVLVRIATILHTEFELPAEIVDHSLSLFQTYLAKMGIAFTLNEIGVGGDDNFIYTRRKVLEELAADRKEFKKRRKEEETQRTQLEHSQLAKWQQSYLEQTQAEEQEEVNEEHLMEVDMINTVDTGLSKQSFIMANLAPLNTNFLLSIVYLACQHAGCNWILLTDLDRWHREDRFRILGKHIYNLYIAYYIYKPVTGAHRFSLMQRTNDALVTNAFDLYSTLSFLIQNLEIPQALHLPPFEKMLHRLVFDLNLPACFWPRINLVLSFLPAVTTELSVDFLRQCSTFLTGEALIEQVINPKRDLPKVKVKRMIDKTFLPNVAEKRGDFLTILPVETKAAAVIMFALKLMFALDDATEYIIDEFSADRPNNFKFTDWLYQTEFRNYARDGTAIENVLNSTFIKKDVLNEETFLRSAGIPGRMYMDSSRAWIVPKRLQFGLSELPFYNCFPADTLNKAGLGSNLAKYAPLRFYGKQGVEIGLSTPNIDLNRHEIYLRQFNKNEMDFALFDQAEETQLPENLVPHDLEWRQMFPAINKVKQIPISRRLSFWVKGKPHVRMDTLRYRLRDERRTFSKSFERLLATMSMLISERVEVLYLAFTMVETAFADSEIYDQPEAAQNPESDFDEVDFASEEETGSDLDMEDDSTRAPRKSRNPLFSGTKLSRNESNFIKHLMRTFW